MTVNFNTFNLGYQQPQYGLVPLNTVPMFIAPPRYTPPQADVMNFFENLARVLNLPTQTAAASSTTTTTTSTSTPASTTTTSTTTPVVAAAPKPDNKTFNIIIEKDPHILRDGVKIGDINGTIAAGTNTKMYTNSDADEDVTITGNMSFADFDPNDPNAVNDKTKTVASEYYINWQGKKKIGIQVDGTVTVNNKELKAGESLDLGGGAKIAKATDGKITFTTPKSTFEITAEHYDKNNDPNKRLKYLDLKATVTDDGIPGTDGNGPGGVIGAIISNDRKGITNYTIDPRGSQFDTTDNFVATAAQRQKWINDIKGTPSSSTPATTTTTSTTTTSANASLQSNPYTQAYIAQTANWIAALALQAQTQNAGLFNIFQPNVLQTASMLPGLVPQIYADPYLSLGLGGLTTNPYLSASAGSYGLLGNGLLGGGLLGNDLYGGSLFGNDLYGGVNTSLNPYSNPYLT